MTRHTGETEIVMIGIKRMKEWQEEKVEEVGEVGE